MIALLTRLGIVVAVSVLSALAVWLGRRYVAARQRAALQSAPFLANAPAATPIRILAFHTADCRQCRTHQTPALDRVLQSRAGQVQVIDIDAHAEPELARQYRVLTVPTTVLLDHAGQARHVNYGFTNTARILDQVDAVLGREAVTAE